MRPLYWAILTAIIVAVGGLIFGVAGIFIAPIVGALAVIALIIWLIERKAHHKLPME